MGSASDANSQWGFFFSQHNTRETTKTQKQQLDNIIFRTIKKSGLSLGLSEGQNLAQDQPDYLVVVYPA